MQPGKFQVQLARGVFLLILVICAGGLSAQKVFSQSCQQDSESGTYATSEDVIHLDLEAGGTAAARDELTIALYPNPVLTTMSIMISGVVSGDYEVSISRQDGTVVKSWTMGVVDGVPGIIDIEKVETGIYNFNLHAGSGTFSAPFLKL